MTRMRRPLRQPAPNLILRPLRIGRRERRGRDRPGLVDLLLISGAFASLLEGFVQVQWRGHPRPPTGLERSQVFGRIRASVVIRAIFECDWKDAERALDQ
jgi:hypothetical protein